ncbi:MAG: YafY family protein [Bacteroidota bacterium]
MSSRHMGNQERTLNRTERLFATILLLQNRPNMTSRDLSDHFGVSRRTIFRDLRALSESGVPLTYADGGGYEILEGYQLPPLMLSAREAATLLIGTEFMKLQPDASLRKDADHVSMKIQSVLPKGVQAFVESLRQSTVLDPYWLHAVQAAEDGEDGTWYKLSEAISHQRSVLMEYYVKSRDEVTKRTVNPLGLVYYTDHWNLIAYDQLREDIRNFRLDAIQMMYVLSERFEKPADFDLATHLKERGSNAQNHRVVVWFARQAYRRARRTIPAKIEAERPTDDGTEVTFYFENLDYVANWLLRYGTQSVVLEPDSLRDRVVRIAEALQAQYRSPAELKA